MLVAVFGEPAIGSKLYSDAKLVGLQPSTKKYKDVAPVSSCVESEEPSDDPYPTVKPFGLKTLEYIDTVHDINKKLRLAPSYPLDLAEIDRKFGEAKLLDNGEDFPTLPSKEVGDELSKVIVGFIKSRGPLIHNLF